MSGGSLDYACWKVGEIAEHVRERAKTPLHRAFAKHLSAVSQALHDLEWMLSGDTGEGSEIEAIRAVLPKGAVLRSLIGEARTAKLELEEEIARAGGA